MVMEDLAATAELVGGSLSTLITDPTAAPLPYDDLKEIVKDLGRIQGGSWNAPELDHPTLAPEGLGTVSWPFAFAHEGTPEALSIHPDVATRGAEHLWLEGKGLDLDNSPCKSWRPLFAVAALLMCCRAHLRPSSRGVFCVLLTGKCRAQT